MSSNDEHGIEPKELKELRKRRGVLKGKLTLFKKHVLTVDNQIVSAEACLDLELRIERVKIVFDEFDTVQDKIETLSTDLDLQLLEREAVENTYYEHVAIAKSFVNQVTTNSSTPNVTTIDHHSETIDSIKFPDIALPSFGGDITQWLEFRDTFDALINQSNLKSIQKFKYLRSCLKDCALNVISSLEFSESSHAIAWKLLCERYNSPKKLVTNHLKALFNLDKIPASSSALRTLTDNLSKHMRVLKNLKVATENWDILIIFFLAPKLDSQTLRKWEEKANSIELPSLQDFKSFLRARADLLDSLSSTEPQPSCSQGQARHQKSTVTTPSSYQQTQVPNISAHTPHNRCPYCENSHYLNQCPNFLALNVKARIQACRNLRLCNNCLRSGHILPNCRSTNCRTCKGKHHTLLHLPKLTETNQNIQASSKPTTLNEQPIFQPSQSLNLHANNLVAERVVILSTALVKVVDTDNRPHTLRALLDSGSQSNFITEKASEKLGFPRNPVNINVSGFGQNKTPITHETNLSIQSQATNFYTNLSCLIVPTICNLRPQLANLDLDTLIFPSKYKLADPTFYEGSIDMLIGAELFYNIICTGQHKLGKGLPTLQNTQLGWVVTGSVITSKPEKSIPTICQFIQTNQLQSLWGENTKNYIPHDEITQCEKTFDSHTRRSDGSFVVNLPLKTSPAVLGRSQHVVYKRFKTLESKFEKDPSYKQNYVDFMREFEQAGHMIRRETYEPCNYLPHHAVVTPEKSTTPLRVVIDASFKTSTGISLNDIQHKGTISQKKLGNILLNFRINEFVISADVEKLYRYIYLNPEQHNLQCILWRESPTEPLYTYTLTTLSFGLKSAPHIATRCLQQLANENKDSFPEAATIINTCFYMDDLLYAGPSEAEVIERSLQVKNILRGANFNLRKWKSNSKKIIQSVSTNIPNIPEPNQNQDTTKILGILWNNNDDYITYSIKVKPMPNKLTKRNVLSIASEIFDPLGLISPVLIIAKMIIQSLWKIKSDWDESIPTSISERWREFHNNLSHVNSIKIPRHVLLPNYLTIELHGFADSSMNAYGATIYLRSIDKSGNIVVRLLCARSRIARKETIPRLELRAASLLANLYNDTKQAINCKLHNCYLWSDSSVTLAWIRTPTINKLKQFVSNRVTEIRSLTNINNWHWVASNENPADIITRGIQPSKLLNLQLWWQGPSWLSFPNSEWPKSNSEKFEQNNITSNVSKNEQINETACYTSNIEPINEFIMSLTKKWSNANKLIRIFAFVLRFIKIIKNKQRNQSSLSVNELKQSLHTLIKYAQIESFPVEYNLLKNGKQLPPTSNILCLNPFFKDDIIRVGGRLARSPYCYDKKYPMILHHTHPITKLIMQTEHIKLLHAGPQLLLSTIREKFWPTHGRSLASKIVHDCVTCFRAKPITCTPRMGDLPPQRTTPSPPFYTTNIDYGGFYLIRNGRGRGYRTSKCYIAIFVCSATKAVHIELVTGLESQMFIAALRRFIARRGKPREIVSDNATTFHGANNELTDLYTFLQENSNDLTYICSEEGIKFRFLPPYTPHMGGLHEAAIKSCKYHLKRVLGQALLTYEEFQTVLIQVEGILNSRPLCPLSTNDTSYSVLTPAHFLIGRSTTSIADYDYTDVPIHRLTHLQQLQQVQQDFWRRWARDYIGTLQQRTKWRSSKGGSLAVGTLVLVKDDRLPSCRWTIGRIIKTHDGEDKLNRVASIQTASKIIKRAFNNICPLPIT